MGTAGLAAPAAVAGPSGPSGSWTNTFDEEFNGTALDTSKWMPNWHGEGGVMNDVGTYAANVSEGGGHLTLTLAGPNSGALIGSDVPGGHKVAVGEYVEASVLFPGNGTSIDNWPAWWTSGPNWPAAGEHDIAEGLGSLTVNYHSPSGPHNQGTIPYWTPATGAQLVHGAIRDRWASMGWELSSLGYPVSDEFAVPGGRRSDFQHGSLTYRFSDGAILIG